MRSGKSTQCGTPNHTLLAAVYPYLLSKTSERMIHVRSHPQCRNFKSVHTQTTGIFIPDIMVTITALIVASRPTDVNGTLFGVRGPWAIPSGSTSHRESLLTSKEIPWEESSIFQVKLEPY